MIPTTQTLRTALADARTRAQCERRDVICLVSAEEMTDASRRGPRGGGPHGIRVIVRPDEPVVFCGLFPM